MNNLNDELFDEKPIKPNAMFTNRVPPSNGGCNLLLFVYKTL